MKRKSYYTSRLRDDEARASNCVNKQRDLRAKVCASFALAVVVALVLVFCFGGIR